MNEARFEFANPKLRDIAAVAKVHRSRSNREAVTLEISVWLIILGSVLTPFVCVQFLQFPLTLFAFILLSYLFSFRVLPLIVDLRRRARRNRIVAHGNLTRDARDPVLYLRPFYTDLTSEPERLDQTTDEELLASVLQDIGPVVAIGDPDEDEHPDKSLPLLGASRIYLRNDDWQTNVEKLMAASQLIVIHTGTSKGLTWEVGAAARQVGPTRLLISLLSLRDLGDYKRWTRYARFKEVADLELKESLDTEIRLPDYTGDAIFIAFDRDWTPKLINVNKWKHRFFRFSFSSLLRETLREVLKQRELRLSWRGTRRYFLLLGLFCYGLLTPAILICFDVVTGFRHDLLGMTFSMLIEWHLTKDDIIPGLTVLVVSLVPMLLSYGLVFVFSLNKNLREHLDRVSSSYR